MESFPGTVITEDFYSIPCDILSPCAVGGVLNQRTIPRIQAPIIVGAANNQLENELADAQNLKEKGILYATDYAINSGGLICAAAELAGSSIQRAKEDTANIFNTIKRVVEHAHANDINTWIAANQLAEQRMHSIARLKNFFL
jgi:leucine dehydrogenase